MTQHIYTTYKHHGADVRVRVDLKDTHRDYCLCFECEEFAPGDKKNCPIAQDTYNNCVRHNLTTPVWECPKFSPGKPKTEVQKDDK